MFPGKRRLRSRHGSADSLLDLQSVANNSKSRSGRRTRCPPRTDDRPDATTGASHDRVNDNGLMGVRGHGPLGDQSFRTASATGGRIAAFSSQPLSGRVMIGAEHAESPRRKPRAEQRSFDGIPGIGMNSAGTTAPSVGFLSRSSTSGKVNRQSLTPHNPRPSQSTARWREFSQLGMMALLTCRRVY